MRKNTGEPRRARQRRGKCRAGGRPGEDANGGRTTAEAIQLAIGLLTASLDSAELQAWAIRALPSDDPAALGDLLAGLHLVSLLLLHQLQAATGQPPAAALQTLAILAETSRDTPSAGQGAE